MVTMTISERTANASLEAVKRCVEQYPQDQDWAQVFEELHKAIRGGETQTHD